MIQNLTPLSRPLYIQIEGGLPSPYLKQLLSKVGNSDIQFMDFTLQGYGEIDEAEERQMQQQHYVSKQMSVIDQQQQCQKSLQSHQNNDKPSKNQYDPQEYIPNMHLLEIDPLTLKLEYFTQTLESFQSVSQDQKRQYILLYLTDADLQTYKNASIQELIKVVHINLSSFGIISRLQRKAKVALYLQKKKKRIWKKKINYDCRKKVADNRLRVKGKFVTRQQACQMLGIQVCNQQTLKDLLKFSSPKMMF